MKPDFIEVYYNLGNALAKMGELDKAIDAYTQALNIEPEMEDAIAHRELVEQLKQQQQNQPQRSGDHRRPRSRSAADRLADQNPARLLRGGGRVRISRPRRPARHRRRCAGVDRRPR